MAIPKLTPYTGQVANPDGSQTQAEFTQNMFDQLSYEAQLATELDATIDGMNQAVTDVENNTAAASASAAAAEASASTAGYKGLWPDTGGSADKGDTYQTQIGGVPTGEYYTALQNTTVDPVGDNVNWKVNVSEVGVNAGDSQLAGGNIWPLSSQESARVGDSGLINVRFFTDASEYTGFMYELSEAVSGEITALDFNNLTATVGGSSVTMKKMVTFAINDIRQFGDISSGDITDAVIAAISNGDGTYLIPDGDYTFSLPFDFPRGFSLSAYDISRGWNCRLTYTGSTFPAVQCDTNEQFVGIRLIHGGQPTNGAGVQFGRDTNFESDSNGTRCEILGFSPNVRYSNLFNSRLSDTRVADSQGDGIELSPTSFGADGGYVTTINMDSLYLTGNIGSGLVDNSPIQAKQLSIQNTIAENNGGTQIKLKSAQVQNLWNTYIENPENTVTAIEANNGYFEHGYINGSNYGIDFGSGSSNGAVKNYKFVGGANPNIRATGATNSKWFYLERCEFSQAPALSTAQMVVYNGCSGDLPAFVPEYSFVITGTVPKFGVGTNPAILRDSEAYLKTATAAPVPANGTLVKTFSYPGTALTAGLCSLTHTAQSPVPDGLVTTIMIATPSSYAIKFINNTGSTINLPETDYIIEVRRYLSLNT